MNRCRYCPFFNALICVNYIRYYCWGLVCECICVYIHMYTHNISVVMYMKCVHFCDSFLVNELSLLLLCSYYLKFQLVYIDFYIHSFLHNIRMSHHTHTLHSAVILLQWLVMAFSSGKESVLWKVLWRRFQLACN